MRSRVPGSGVATRFPFVISGAFDEENALPPMRIIGMMDSSSMGSPPKNVITKVAGVELFDPESNCLDFGLNKLSLRSELAEK